MLGRNEFQRYYNQFKDDPRYATNERELAAVVAAYAEKPANYQDPTSAAYVNYRRGYDTVMRYAQQNSSGTDDLLTGVGGLEPQYGPDGSLVGYINRDTRAFVPNPAARAQGAGDTTPWGFQSFGGSLWAVNGADGTGRIIASDAGAIVSSNIVPTGNGGQTAVLFDRSGKMTAHQLVAPQNDYHFAADGKVWRKTPDGQLQLVSNGEDVMGNMRDGIVRLVRDPESGGIIGYETLVPGKTSYSTVQVGNKVYRFNTEDPEDTALIGTIDKDEKVIDRPDGSAWVYDPNTKETRQLLGPTKPPIVQMGDAFYFFDQSANTLSLLATAPREPERPVVFGRSVLIPNSWSQPAQNQYPSSINLNSGGGVGGGQDRVARRSEDRYQESRDWRDVVGQAASGASSWIGEHGSQILGGVSGAPFDTMEWDWQSRRPQLHQPMRTGGLGLIPGWDAAMQRWAQQQMGQEQVGEGQDMPMDMPMEGGPWSSGGWAPPVDPSSVVGTGNKFGEEVSVEGFHKGSDLQAVEGTPALAPVSGTVVAVGYDEQGLGLQVAIRDDATGEVHRLSHLADAGVKPGDKVEVGQEVGRVGSTGNSTGPHLDYRVQDQAGNYENPEERLGPLGQMPRADGPVDVGGGQDYVGSGAEGLPGYEPGWDDDPNWLYNPNDSTWFNTVDGGYYDNNGEPLSPSMSAPGGNQPAQTIPGTVVNPFTNQPFNSGQPNIYGGTAPIYGSQGQSGGYANYGGYYPYYQPNSPYNSGITGDPYDPNQAVYTPPGLGNYDPNYPYGSDPTTGAPNSYPYYSGYDPYGGAPGTPGYGNLPQPPAAPGGSASNGPITVNVQQPAGGQQGGYTMMTDPAYLQELQNDLQARMAAVDAQRYSADLQHQAAMARIANDWSIHQDDDAYRYAAIEAETNWRNAKNQLDWEMSALQNETQRISTLGQVYQADQNYNIALNTAYQNFLNHGDDQQYRYDVMQAEMLRENAKNALSATTTALNTETQRLQIQQQMQKADQDYYLGLMEAYRAYYETGNKQQFEAAQLMLQDKWNTEKNQLTLATQQIDIAAQRELQGTFEQRAALELMKSALTNPWLQELSGMAPGFGEPGGPDGAQVAGPTAPPTQPGTTAGQPQAGAQQGGVAAPSEPAGAPPVGQPQMGQHPNAPANGAQAPTMGANTAVAGQQPGYTFGREMPSYQPGNIPGGPQMGAYDQGIAQGQWDQMDPQSRQLAEQIYQSHLAAGATDNQWAWQEAMQQATQQQTAQAQGYYGNRAPAERDPMYEAKYGPLPPMDNGMGGIGQQQPAVGPQMGQQPAAAPAVGQQMQAPGAAPAAQPSIGQQMTGGQTQPNAQPNAQPAQQPAAQQPPPVTAQPYPNNGGAGRHQVGSGQDSPLEHIRDPWMQEFQRTFMEELQTHPNTPEFRDRANDPYHFDEDMRVMQRGPEHGSSGDWEGIRTQSHNLGDTYPYVRPQVGEQTNWPSHGFSEYKDGPNNPLNQIYGDATAPRPGSDWFQLGHINPRELAREFASRVNGGVVGPWDFWPGGPEAWLRTVVPELERLGDQSYSEEELDQILRPYFRPEEDRRGRWSGEEHRVGRGQAPAGVGVPMGSGMGLNSVGSQMSQALGGYSPSQGLPSTPTQPTWGDYNNMSIFERAALRTQTEASGVPWAQYTNDLRNTWAGAGGPTQAPGMTMLGASRMDSRGRIGAGQIAETFGNTRDEYWEGQQRSWAPSRSPNVSIVA